MHIRKYIWGICYGLILTAFTGYVLLDTFVTKQIYSIAPSEDMQIADTGTDNWEQILPRQENTDIVAFDKASDEASERAEHSPSWRLVCSENAIRVPPPGTYIIAALQHSLLEVSFREFLIFTEQRIG